MSTRLTLIVAAIVGVLGLAGLAVAATAHQQPTAFSVELPAAKLTTPLASGQGACQAPIRASSAFGGVRLWVWPGSRPSPPLMVQVRAYAGNAVLATGGTEAVPRGPRTPPGDPVSLYPSPVSGTAVLTRPVAAGQDVKVCVRNLGPGTTTFMGSTANNLSGALSIAGKPAPVAMSLVFLRPRSRSLLSLLPTAFRRAALFRPTWVGAWTFWLLGFGLLLAFGLAAWAVVLACRADGRDADRATSPRASS